MWRTGAKYFVDGAGGFNNDKRLSTAMQLSRLVHTTVSATRARPGWLSWEGNPLEIIPARAEGRGARIVVANPDEDWFRDTDVPEIAALIAAFSPSTLPNRVKRAMICISNTFTALTTSTLVGP